MSDRRWQPGEDFWCDGVHYRTRQGRKDDDDVVLEHYTEDGWRAVGMESGFLRADFFFENEEVLYPRSRGYDGGWYYLKWCQKAAVHLGWEQASRRLEQAKRTARERRSAGWNA